MEFIEKHNKKEGGLRLPLFLVTLLFFSWGLAHNMTDTLLAAFKKILSLSDFQTSWVQLAFYGAYFCFALPAALFIRRFSYKSGILLGLGLYIIGAFLFYPASLTMQYGSFLFALYVLAAGLSVLETAANPYILEMGDSKTATRRLNWVQSFNPIGSMTGVLLSKVFILSGLASATAAERAVMDETTMVAMQQDELSAMIGPYIGVACGLLVLWIIIGATKMSDAQSLQKNIVENKQSIWKVYRNLCRSRSYTCGLIAQFFYIGAQIGVWSFTIRYTMIQLHINEAEASSYYLYSLILFAASRFFFTWLMRFVDPRVLLSGTAILAVLLSVVVMMVGGVPGVCALVLISFCMSLMFPTIYALSMEHVKNDKQLAGAGQIMTILGGAILTSFQGYLSDITGSVSWAYAVPMFCFVMVFTFSTGKYVVVKRREQAELETI